MDKYYSLTKTLILSGIQCEKKLWFDLNEKIKSKDKAIFRLVTDLMMLLEVITAKVSIYQMKKNIR